MELKNTFSDHIPYPRLNTYKGLYGKIPIRSESTYMGIEVEAENISRSLRSIPGSFKCVEDGSLKVSGKEFVTVPIKLKYLEVELTRLFQAIPKATFSNRTSIHVHMNARDFSVENLLVFMMLYTILERPLYRMSGDRWNNNFCIPIRSAPDNLFFLMQYLRGGVENLDTLFGNGIRWDKYLGINLCPMLGMRDQSAKYGTIEFRHMAGTNSVRRIIDWCNIIACIKIFAKMVPVNQMVEFVKRNDVSYVTDIFQEWSPLILPKENHRELIEGNSFLKYVMSRALLFKPKEVQQPIPEPVITPQRAVDIRESIIMDDMVDTTSLTAYWTSRYARIEDIDSLRGLGEAIPAPEIRVRRNQPSLRDIALSLQASSGTNITSTTTTPRRID